MTETNQPLIAITGAAGFIGSRLVSACNDLGLNNLLLVDDFSNADKVYNLSDSHFHAKVHREQFAEWLSNHPQKIDFIFHLGARTDTTSQDIEVFKELNLKYSKAVWEYCVEAQIPLVYASSAATYGDGALGYKDDEQIINQLKPLNPYAVSKNDFDEWVIEQKKTPPHWYGLKFFNVFGPNEYHKGRMASVVFHAFHQIKQNGTVKLFRSHRKEYKDGGQMRDFIYVKDVVKVCLWLRDNLPKSGIYNLGTGKARTFNDLVNALFTSLSLPANIEYIDTPKDIRGSYQYFTEAAMQKLFDAGYTDGFNSLEEAVDDYVKEHLLHL